MRFLKEIKRGAFIRDAENSSPADPLYCDFQRDRSCSAFRVITLTARKRRKPRASSNSFSIEFDHSRRCLPVGLVAYENIEMALRWISRLSLTPSVIVSDFRDQLSRERPVIRFSKIAAARAITV